MPYLGVIKIGQFEYSDGGSMFNNPTRKAYRELRDEEPQEPHPFGIMVSIGTGKKADRPRKRKVAKGFAKTLRESPWRAIRHPRSTVVNRIKHHPLWKAGRRALAELLDGEKVHEEFRKKMSRKGWSDKYFRWNDPHIGVLKLDQWKDGKGTNELPDDIVED